MQRLYSALPALALRPFVRAYAQRTYSLRAAIVEPSPPCVESVLAFVFGAGLSVCLADGTVFTPPRASIVGPNLCLGTSFRLSQEVDLFAVFFQPAGFSDLFGLPIHCIINTHLDATTVCRGLGSIWEQLAEAASFDERVSIAETCLFARIPRATPSADMQTANVILRAHGTPRIRDLAQAQALGVRQFERRFSAAVGASPKTFARVARFQSALDAKITNQTRTWIDIAHAFGYHDQMHMIHDFEQISGSAPQALMKVLGDARPPILAMQSGDDTPRL